MLKTRVFFATAVAVTAALALTACGGTNANDESQTPSAATSSSDFNDADVTFAQMMIPHHKQAVEMSDDLLAKDDIDPDVVDLALEIKAAQEPEITQLNLWLTDWDADSGMSGMDMGDGMMSEGDMMALQDASGDAASRLFLEQMTVHHEGAIEMAQLEIRNGKNAGAQAMAENIATTQTTEIDVMAELLATL